MAATIGILIYLALMVLAVDSARPKSAPRVPPRVRTTSERYVEQRPGLRSAAAQAWSRWNSRRLGRGPLTEKSASARGSKSSRINRWPVSTAARHWKPDHQWLRGAFCIHNHESVDWHRRWTDWRNARSPYAGGMQFLQSTWETAGGKGEPWQWAPREQLYRAFVIWRMDGGSWHEWGTAGACGLG